MFSDNSVAGARHYFHEKLSGLYNEQEINVFFELTCLEKFRLSRTDLLKNNEKFSESELLTFRSVVKQLQDHCPIQYVLGKAYFMNIELKVGKGVLCPRPETEELTALIIKENQKGDLLDIGTGSGAIPLAVKFNRPKLHVTGVDISELALSYANENARALGLEANFIQMDILNEQPDQQFDVIVSNPPYVPLSDQNEMQPNVLLYEPHEALFVPDNDPFRFYEKVAFLCDTILKPNGTLYFEIHERFGNELSQLLKAHDFSQVDLLKDLQGKDRMLKAKKAP